MIAITGELTAGGSSDNKLPGKELLADRVAAAVNAPYHLLDRRIANLPGGLLEVGDSIARQLLTLQLVKAEQADVAAPVEANAL